MKTDKSSFFQIIKRKEILLFLVLFIAGISLLGWLLGKIIIASVSLKFIPMAPSTAVLFFLLSIIAIVKSNFEKTRVNQLVSAAIIVMVAVYCLLILGDYFFNFSWDIEDVFLVNPGKFGHVSIGRMSPITSMLFFFICISILADTKNNSKSIRYIGGSFSLSTSFIASVLVIGYIYKAPLLYGGQIIPVALPTAICFLLFGITFLRISKVKYWTFNLIKNNPTEFLLLKTFLPLVVFAVVLQGFIETNFSLDQNNPTLTSAIIILLFVLVTIFIVIRASSVLGNKLMRAEKILKQSEVKFRLLADFAYDWEYWVGSDSQIIYMSPSCERISGYSAEEFLADDLLVLKIIYPDDLKAVKDHFKKFHFLDQAQNKEELEFRILKKDGTIVYIAHLCRPVFDDKGIYIGRRISNREITDQKLAEEEINLKNEELQKLNAEKDKFFSIIAHDLRSPFSGFLGLTKIMAEELPNLKMAEIQKIAVNMENSATNLYRLLENLLQWAKMQQGLIPFAPEKILLHTVVDESITMMFDIARNKGIEIIADIPNDIIVFADNNLLQAVMRNLVSNALKFTPKGGKISLSAKINGNSSVEISIRDTGIGMNKELLDKLFRLDGHTSRQGTEGEPSTGLGLLLCKEFIEKHGGKIWVKSEVGNGSVFYFTLSDNAANDEFIGRLS